MCEGTVKEVTEGSRNLLQIVINFIHLKYKGLGRLFAIKFVINVSQWYVFTVNLWLLSTVLLSSNTLISIATTTVLFHIVCRDLRLVRTEDSV